MTEIISDDARTIALLELHVVRLRAALGDIADRLDDDSEHCRAHDAATCEVVPCVAKRALRAGSA